jgi:hypothetical protein
MEAIDSQLSPGNLKYILKEDERNEPGDATWEKAQESDPPLPDLGEPWKRPGNFPALASHPQFRRLWKHLEPLTAPCYPELEVIPGDGDCLYSCISRFLEWCGENRFSTRALREHVANVIVGNPRLYTTWGILADEESPARSAEAYAEAMIRPCSAYGGQLELNILQDWFRFRYYSFDIPGGHVDFRTGNAEGEFEALATPLILVYHSNRRHYDLIIPVPDPRGSHFVGRLSGGNDEPPGDREEPEGPREPEESDEPPGQSDDPEGRIVNHLLGSREFDGMPHHSWYEQQPSLPHFLKKLIGRIYLSCGSRPIGLADVVILRSPRNCNLWG